MLDVARLRDEADALWRELERKGVSRHDFEAARRADARWREALGQAEAWRARRRQGSEAVARAGAAERPALIADMRAVATATSEAEDALRQAEEEARVALARLPNPPHPGAPSGGPEDFAVVRTWGDTAGAARFGHAELGTTAGLWDLERAAKVSGSRFAFLVHGGVLLEQALIRYAMTALAGRGFSFLVPPVMVREEAMFGTGFFPAEASEYYEVDGRTLFLAGTAEVPLAGFHQGEILEELPLRYAGLSTCFRREAGAAGRDTAGIFRVHQFNKLEMFVYAAPDTSDRQHQALLEIQEELVRGLGIPYRVVDIAAADLGSPAARKFDIEAWLPSEGRYREITSCSNCTDFQARRLRVRRRSTNGTELVHTLNGTAVVDRWLVFIAEHYQDADGAIVVPDALRPHLVADVDRVGPV